ncbi:MAG: 4Fe-4S dicluster domain-containing protein [Candidatus Omnitrophica bacterium]|nr:4Fe-4S dicluster domain-containing protein [Candidatus Omnitrophota bacterium]
MIKGTEVYYVKNEEWQKFLKQTLTKYCLYAPGKGLVEPEYRIFGPEEDLSQIVYGGARTTQPLKFFIYPPREKVSPDQPSSDEKTIILGVKACDLKALSVLDKIFLDPDFPDPFYQKRRENTILISDDCTEPKESCFCILLGGNPFPEEGFDLNLSFLPARPAGGNKGILVEVGSKKGKDLLEEYKIPLLPAEENHLKMRQEKREKVIGKLKKINKDFKFPQDPLTLTKGKYDSPVWSEVSEDCVGCAACTNICPACHCFLLAEVLTTKFEKERYWDSCQYTGFARVAAGANPRKKLMERFRNRFYCKLEHKPENFELLACTGCGRCIEACQGKIDIREVLTKVARSKE